jgi:hypothetical protein
VKVQHEHAEARGLAHGAGHGVRDVVVLQIEEDAEAALERALDGRRARPR